ncbi:hypothetical protein GCM10009733_028710 [Nonomuraea maheshkhaliensis]|uniref:Recombination endonuclease VII n=2 Tax=Nonomuraea maheshkhaliensis TaxID=419590 RepID=A0ABN2F6N0_9ACTN
MLAQQGGLCAVCRTVPGTFVDHCHRTGAVRGILCFNCDNGLGHFGDNLVLLELAALYLDGEVLWPEFVVLPEQRDGGVVPPTRGHHLGQRYQVRHEDVERMVAAQRGLCVVCWDRPPEHVDHCHRTGEVRYALCLPCNTGIGRFRDDAAVVWRALAYVEAGAGDVGEALVAEAEVSDAELEALVRAEEELRSEFYRQVTRVGWRPARAGRGGRAVRAGVARGCGARTRVGACGCGAEEFSGRSSPAACPVPRCPGGVLGRRPVARRGRTMTVPG